MIRAAVLGADVRRSLSPRLHEAAFRALGRPGRYDARSVGPREFSRLVRELFAEGFRYLNVTIPHKAAAARLAESRSRFVATCGAANTLHVVRGRLRAENTDGAGLLAALGDLGIRRLVGKPVVVVGAGGAAAAAIVALRAAGAQITQFARKPRASRRIGVKIHALAGDEFARACSACALLVSAIPAEAWRAPGLRAGLAALRRTSAVYEMAYARGRTPLARAVTGRVRRYADGRAMLVHQARFAIELTCGRRPPLLPMRRAAGDG